jgi:hypothetical protein
MSQFKNNPNIKLFYSDTDSAYVNKQLDDSLVSSKVLGAMKLESVNTKAIFLAPKVYGLQDQSGKITIKAKGIKETNIKDLNLEDLEKLLIKDSNKIFNQEKWYRNREEGNIKILDTLFTLKMTEKKRDLIYESHGGNNKLIGTRPLCLPLKINQ